MRKTKHRGIAVVGAISCSISSPTISCASPSSSPLEAGVCPKTQIAPKARGKSNKTTRTASIFNVFQQTVRAVFAGAGIRHPGRAVPGLPEIGGPGTRTKEALVGPIDCATLYAAALAIITWSVFRCAHAAPPVHGLRMLATRLGDAAQGAPRAGRAVGKGDVAEREIPTKRFSRLSTGSRRSLMSAIFCTTSSRSSSSSSTLLLGS